MQVHGEVTNPEVDIFDREKVFIGTILSPLVQKFPQLKVVMEHVTTMDAVKFVESCPEGNFCNVFIIFGFSFILLSCWLLIVFCTLHDQVNNEIFPILFRVCCCYSHPTASCTEQEFSFPRRVTTTQLLPSSAQERNSQCIFNHILILVLKFFTSL